MTARTGWFGRLLRLLAPPRTEGRRPPRTGGGRPPREAQGGTPSPHRSSSREGASPSPGRPGAAEDFRGTARVDLRYAARNDGRPDPGEVVWAWVPFEEDRSQGKDRPVLVIGRTGSDLLALMMTSQDHDRDVQQEARYGRRWLDVGVGGWDRQGRPSEVRLDRILRVRATEVRREGAALDRAIYEQVTTAVREVNGW